MGFDTSHLLAVLPRLFEAALINARVALIVMAIALTLGTLLTIVRAMKIRVVNAVIAGWISFIRGTPLLIQIFLCYYALPRAGIDMSPMVAGITAIALNSAVFITEIQRGALRTLDPGQIEAATALGLSRFAIWAKVVLPQVMRRAAPVFVNEATIVVKGTALLSVITVVEVLRVAQQVASSSFKPFETLIAAAFVFLLLNLALVLLGQWIEAQQAGRRT